MINKTNLIFTRLVGHGLKQNEIKYLIKNYFKTDNLKQNKFQENSETLISIAPLYSRIFHVDYQELYKNLQNNGFTDEQALIIKNVVYNQNKAFLTLNLALESFKKQLVYKNALFKIYI